MNQLSDYEIMAPVGSRDSLAAALKAGAGSVYFGVEQLNMRSHSANHFTIDDLRDIAAQCNEAGVKTYLTVNTIIYGEDIEMMHQIVDAAVEAHITAVIACDIAVMTYCRKVGMEVHLSTQLNISNIEALKFYAQFADVVVLARELKMEQVADIYRQIEEQHICGPSGQLVRIEMFCHGALCMAVSGKCYMSLDNTGRSANRGACMQICRRSYIVTDRETGTELEIDNKYIMSPKDLKFSRCSTVPSLKLRKTLGTSDWLRSLIADFGTAIIRDSSWVSGTRTTVRTQQSANSTSVKASNTSRSWVSPSLLLRPILSVWAIRC